MNYTLRDKEYFEALRILAEEFERQNIGYALVGGTGVQARIVDIVCRAQKVTIPDINGLEHLLRETKDFDITSNATEVEFTRFFNEFQALHSNISVETESIRSKKIRVRGKEEAIVFVNYQTGPQDLSGLDENFYSLCISTAEPLLLRYRGTKFPVYVATPECLVTSKLTRNDPKDIWDIATLLRTMRLYRRYAGKFRQEKVKEYLEKANRGEIIGRIEEIKKQIIKE